MKKCEHDFRNLAQAFFVSVANWGVGSPAILQCKKCLGVYRVKPGKDVGKDVDVIMKIEVKEKAITVRGEK